VLKDLEADFWICFGKAISFILIDGNFSIEFDTVCVIEGKNALKVGIFKFSYVYDLKFSTTFYCPNFYSSYT
jgi:hypothetical protein